MDSGRVRRVRPSGEGASEETVEVVSTSVTGQASPTVKQRTLSVRKFVTQPAYVGVSAGVTKETGSYEFLRVDITVNMPCYVEEVDRVSHEVAEYVAQRLDEEITEYLGGEE
mgnify:CR=1 FL=1|jgi:hypothetical protein